MMPRSRGPEVLDLLLSRTSNQWTRLSTCIFTTAWAKRWQLNGLSLGTARASRGDIQVPACGEAALLPTLPMAGQASPRPRGSKDMAHKECGCRRDRRLVATDLPLREEEPPPPPPPFTSYIVSTPPGGFPPPQGFPQDYGAPPQFSFGYRPPSPPPAHFAPPGVPPPQATPGAAPLAFPPPPSQAAQDMSKPLTAQPDFPYGHYAGYRQDLSGFGQGFSDPSQQPPSYGGPSVPGSGPPPAGGSGFGRGQNHNVQGFHSYRR
ncbi:hypothetical protein P7K49_039426 [Saguinus oedipus]|uniref:DAZ-associated protein 1 n=1 Tax=Saguinus oedipus TaxID=9490 RepID=A0ABQ9TBW4_SAGOE|nr:hypothetical protein P7K49_039426 [Saguinus oedipus]